MTMPKILSSFIEMKTSSYEFSDLEFPKKFRCSENFSVS